LEIVSPLPEHAKAKVVVSDLLKVLLDELDMPWESLGSTTFRREEMAAGIEPDDCFYIQHQAAMVGKDRVDLAVDPPPDLVIEIDVTSTTALQAYEALQVPELWRYHNRALQIFVLRDGTYVLSPRSPTFPHIPIVEGVTQFVEMSRTAGTAPALRAFRQWVREHIQS
jgi:Uma2 family endonuclease